ncbi:MAG: 1,4-alpha-glucan branching protein GlgB [Vulcanimicrobiota bacterium]
MLTIDERLPLTDFDVHLWNQSRFYRSYEKLGAHLVEGGARFAVWAPNAARVSVIGDFNGWREDAHPLHRSYETGIWFGFVPGVEHGSKYKYAIHSQHNGYTTHRADPYGFCFEMRPNTATRVWDLEQHQWGDHEWMAKRAERDVHRSPMSIYEVHLGSWKRGADGNWLTYRQIADDLASYVAEMGYTHVELLPVTEHPFDGSWGYQAVGYFAPTSRFGTPEDFMYLVDTLHQHGVGVILDWVPAHFPKDRFALAFFDGTHLYEHADPRRGEHPEWGTLIFNYGRNEVRNFLISSALFWLDRYHIDGIRVDAVASMLYLDYGRDEFLPNQFGGRENLEAVEFLRDFNQAVAEHHPGVFTMAEESTSWPKVTAPAEDGGLGFSFKWNMGWMNDTLEYFEKEPIHRKYHHRNLTFGMIYQWSERFMLPLSHDEVVHLKKALLTKMPGDDWQRMANHRLLLAYQAAYPGKKLLFMGGEFGQWQEWSFERSLDWHLLDQPEHQALQRWARMVNHLYRDEPALHQLDQSWEGFEWVDCDNADASVVSFLRFPEGRDHGFLFIFNYTPVPRLEYQVGLPWGGQWEPVANSDDPEFGGSGFKQFETFEAQSKEAFGKPYSARLDLPPLGVVILRSTRPVDTPEERGQAADSGDDAAHQG